jgi:hypothetical protein
MFRGSRRIIVRFCTLPCSEYLSPNDVSETSRDTGVTDACDCDRFTSGSV